MCADWSRRDALRRGAVAAVPLVAGCLGGSGDDTGTPPSNEAYGVQFENRASQPMTVRAKATKTDADEPHWETEEELSGGERTTVDEVITDQVEQVVIAELVGVTATAKVEPAHTQSNLWITPGSESAPSVKNLQVVTDVVDNEYSDRREYVVGVTHPKSSITPWAGP